MPNRYGSKPWPICHDYCAAFEGQAGRTILDEDGSAFKSRHMIWLVPHTLYFAPEVGPQAVAGINWNSFQGSDDPFFIGKPLVVVSGPQTVATLQAQAAALQDKTVLYVPAAGVDTARRRQLIQTLGPARQTAPRCGVMTMRRAWPRCSHWPGHSASRDCSRGARSSLS